MIELVYSPVWFFGKDIIIDVVSIIVLSLVGLFSIKYHRMNKKKSNLLFGISFLMLAASFLFKIMTNFTIYYPVVVTKNLGFFVVTFRAMKATNVLLHSGFLIYRLLTLVGLYLLLSTYTKQKMPSIILISYFIIISTIFSQSAIFVFFLTSLVMLSLITMCYIRDFKKSKRKLLAISFLTITISQAIFIFIALDKLFYVIAESIQLIGYVLMLVAFTLVLYHGKKK
ncbi:hypothetical protein JXA85_00275 [Candidatus Woesearchaeota archaeon]|nr:hypothetical protein [Candidatus Woesearchaeota archaeon]